MCLLFNLYHYFPRASMKFLWKFLRLLLFSDFIKDTYKNPLRFRLIYPPR